MAILTPQSKTNPFLRQSEFHLSPSSVWFFIFLGVAAWLLNVGTQMVFPSQNLLPYIIRTTVLALTVVLTTVGSIRLLKQNHLPAEALGLGISVRSLLNFLLGACISVIFLLLIGTVLYLFVPFHFTAGALSGIQVIKECYSYFWGNFLEELIFRGFLLIVLSNLIGWRRAVWVMALPFALFHLPGIGFGMEALKMMVTSSVGGLLFSYAFTATSSLWTAIGAHVMGNILLHTLTGLDGAGRAMFQPSFEDKFPVGYDANFLTFTIAGAIVAYPLFVLAKKRLEGSTGSV
ncbi:CPBP family intramembrane glutamic endopeptidase [Chryseolinea soli]|uniref:CPBP family intramembrane metalloprotease n=1 Tax=Chryseolinea soli TaxID=2321403 RepID=A0A385SV50_9BACT|nr:type II CAAX endopeptidase family protein [Chryseolinea soli]AYB34702.1 CPBP family intramembrane metalloprotease [Chryseolinea soli]